MASLRHYESHVETIWRELELEGSKRHPNPSRSGFERVYEAFYQAECGPQDPEPSDDLRAYRAELNLWLYYFGEESESHFPGKFPATLHDNTFESTRKAQYVCSPPDPVQTRAVLEQRFAASPFRHGYVPQLGWNPSTGEPWMAIRCYAYNAYPSLSGPEQSYLHQFQEAINWFVIQYERFTSDGYLLIWPEFASPAYLKDDECWRQFSVLRNFLERWAGRDEAYRIQNAWVYFCALDEELKGPLPLPEGFELDYDKVDEMIKKDEMGNIRELPIGPPKKRTKGKYLGRHEYNPKLIKSAYDDHFAVTATGGDYYDARSSGQGNDIKTYMADPHNRKYHDGQYSGRKDDKRDGGDYHDSRKSGRRDDTDTYIPDYNDSQYSVKRDDNPRSSRDYDDGHYSQRDTKEYRRSRSQSPQRESTYHRTRSPQPEAEEYRPTQSPQQESTYRQSRSPQRDTQDSTYRRTQSPQPTRKANSKSDNPNTTPLGSRKGRAGRGERVMLDSWRPSAHDQYGVDMDHQDGGGGAGGYGARKRYGEQDEEGRYGGEKESRLDLRVEAPTHPATDINEDSRARADTPIQVNVTPTKNFKIKGMSGNRGSGYKGREIKGIGGSGHRLRGRVGKGVRKEKNEDMGMGALGKKGHVFRKGYDPDIFDRR